MVSANPGIPYVRMEYEQLFMPVASPVLSFPAVTVELVHGTLSLLCHWENKGADTTLVTFSGAVGSKVETVPAFLGMRVTSPFSVNRLLISDPALALSSDLRLGWYAGTNEWSSLPVDVSEVIHRFSMGGRTVLFGPSGGGFAALEQSVRIPGATVLAVNPQTDILMYDRAAVERYRDICWPGHGEFRQDETPFIHSVVSRFAEPVDASVIYVQNTGDRFHVRQHLNPFREAAHSSNKIFYAESYFGDGHIGPSAADYHKLLEAILGTAEWDEIVKRVESLKIPQGG